MKLLIARCLIALLTFGTLFIMYKIYDIEIVILMGFGLMAGLLISFKDED